MKSYLRFLSRNKLYTAIKAVGLTVALTFVIVFTCYVRQQMAVCYHYPDYDRIYLVGLDGKTQSYSHLADQIRSGIPEVEEAVMVQRGVNVYLYEGKTASDEQILSISKEFFDIFQTRFLSGSPEDLKAGSSVLVTESFARRHGMEEVIGKKIITDRTKSPYDIEELVIVGIIEDFTDSIFDDYEIVRSHQENSVISYGAAICTFIKIKADADIESVKAKIPAVANFFEEYTEQPVAVRLDKLYWNKGGADTGARLMKSENIDRMIIFSIVVLFLLISAIINYINLNIANAEKRAKELAIRYVIGENRCQIFIRTLVESFAFITTVFALSVAGAALVIDWVNDLLRTDTPIELSFSADYIGIYCILIVIISIANSVAVSLTASRFGIRSSTRIGRSASRLFIGLQSVISFVMIAIALTMELQMKHMLERDINANIDNIYFTNINSKERLRKQIEALPGVKAIGNSFGYPGNVSVMNFSLDRNTPGIGWMRCDTAAFRMFGYEKTEEFQYENPIGIWMSESTADYYNISSDNLILKTDFYIFDGPVAGIVKDSPTRNILTTEGNELFIIQVLPDSLANTAALVLEVEENKENRQLLDSLIQADAMQRFGQESIGHGFIRDLTKAEYNQTRRDIRMVEIFMFIAIMLSCLAFLAMSMHYAEKNQGNIAVHKVFGGDTESELFRNLTVYFKIMAISVAIGLPAAIWFSGRYLEKFAFRFELEDKWWVFPLAILISMSISTLTVLWQTLRAARTNPAEVLKKE